MPFYFDPLSTCDVCLEHFSPPGSGEERDGKTPHVLPCGHVFCLDCLVHVEGPCPHCRQPFRNDRIHRVHVDTSRDVSPPADVHNALRSIDAAAERVRRYEERNAGLSGIDLEDLFAQIQAFVFVHADKAILDIVYCIATVLEKYADMASQTAGYEQRIRRHEREEAEEKRRRDTLEGIYMDTIANLEASLEQHSIPSPLPPPSQILGAPSPAPGARRYYPAPPAISRSVSREDRQRSIQYEAELRLQEETGEPVWGRETVEQGNALGLNRTRASSSSTSGGLHADAATSTERRPRTEHRRNSTTRRQDADVLLSPVDLMTDAPSSSRVPYHPGRPSEPSGSHGRQSSRQERTTASGRIYRQGDDSREDLAMLGAQAGPSISRRSNSTTPFIPPAPLHLSGNAAAIAGPSDQTPFIPPPPPGWRDSVELPSDGPTTTSANVRANRQAPPSTPYIPSPPREPTNFPSNPLTNLYYSTHEDPPATYIPSPLQEPTRLPTNSAGSTSHSRSHSLHRGNTQQVSNPDNRQPRRPPVQPPVAPAPTHQSSSRRVPSSAHTPHPNPPALPGSSNDRSRRSSFSGQPAPDSRYAPRTEPASRPVILPTPAAGPSASNAPLLGVSQQHASAHRAPSAMRNRSRSISGPAPLPPPMQVPAAESSRPAPAQYSTHGAFPQMPNMSRRPTAPPSVASSAGSTWSTAPAVGATPQAAHSQFAHGRHPSADTTISHSRHPSLNRHHSNASTTGRRPSIDASGSSSHRPPPVAIPPTSAPYSGQPLSGSHPLAHHSGLPVSQSQMGYGGPYPYGGGGYPRSALDSSGPPPPLARSAPGSSMHTPAPIHASVSQPAQMQRPPAPRQESNNLLF